MSEKAVRTMVCHISSTTVTRRAHIISSDTGSASINARASAIGVAGVMRAAAGSATAMRMRMVPVASTIMLSPGAMMVVDSRSSIIAGPAISTPCGRA